MEKEIITSVLALGLVIGLIFLTSYIMRLLQNRQGAPATGTKKHMHVQQTLFLDGRNKLMLISKDDGTEYLALISPSGSQIIKCDADCLAKDS